MTTLPLDIKLDILINTDIDTFQDMCLADSELYEICANTDQTSELAQYTNYLYEQRTKKLFSQDLINLKENETWKEFYEALTDIIDNLDNLNSELADELLKFGKFTILRILSKIPPPKGPIFPQRQLHMIENFENIMDEHLSGNESHCLILKGLDINTLKGVRIYQCPDRNPNEGRIYLNQLNIYLPVVGLKDKLIFYTLSIIKNSKYSYLVEDILSHL